MKVMFILPEVCRIPAFTPIKKLLSTCHLSTCSLQLQA